VQLLVCTGVGVGSGFTVVGGVVTGGATGFEPPQFQISRPRSATRQMLERFIFDPPTLNKGRIVLNSHEIASPLVFEGTA
jgi:hypothetical protein